MADEEREKCDHPGCNCLQAEDSDYCSVYCETAGDNIELSCDCGHGGCGLAA